MALPQFPGHPLQVLEADGASSIVVKQTEDFGHVLPSRESMVVGLAGYQSRMAYIILYYLILYVYLYIFIIYNVCVCLCYNELQMYNKYHRNLRLPGLQSN